MSLVLRWRIPAPLVSLRWRGPAGMLDAIARAPGAAIAAVVGPPGEPGPPVPAIVRVAGEALGGHRAVKVGSDGQAWYVSPTDADVAAIAGITAGAASLGGSVSIVATGELAESGWAWSPGPIYLAAGGLLSQTPPTSGAIVLLGTALGPAAMYVAPRLVARL